MIDLSPLLANADVVSLFSGAGGWLRGCQLLEQFAVGHPAIAAIGVELEPIAAQTHTNAGGPTVVASVLDIDLTTIADLVRGIIASPPCQTISTAGKGAGRKWIAHICQVIYDGGHTITTDDSRTDLILEPLRWCQTLRPEWMVCEQVPAALPIWSAMAHRLAGDGYSCWAGNLEAEQYGVGQARTRAVLIASRVRTVGEPPPTHQRYRKGIARGQGRECQPPRNLLPWVTMGEALAASPIWGDEFTVAQRRGAGMEDRHGARPARTQDEPAPTVTAKQSRSEVVLAGAAWNETETVLNGGSTETQPNRRKRPMDEPAPTLAFGHDASNWQFERPATAVLASYVGITNPGGGGRDVSMADRGYTPYGPERGVLRSNQADRDRPKDADGVARVVNPDTGEDYYYRREQDLPGPAVTGNVKDWRWERPSTGVMADPRIAQPGHKDAATPQMTDAVRVMPSQALLLQSFPADWPMADRFPATKPKGSTAAVFRQIGNAVPPFLAAHVLAEAVGAELGPLSYSHLL